MGRAFKSAVSLFMAMALFCGGFICPAGAETAGTIDGILANMSLRDKLAQMMVVSLRSWKADYTSEDAAESITELNDFMRAYLSEHRFGGMVVFAENCVDAEQTLRLTSEMKSATLEGGGVMPLIAVDQEGGSVARLGFGTTGVGNMALTATGDPACAREMAAVYG